MNPSRERQKGWAVVHKAATEWEAEMARDLLIEHGIPAVTHSYMTTPYGGMLSVQMPCVAEVMVPNTCLADAEQFLDAMLSDGSESE